MTDRFQALRGKLAPKYDYVRGTVEEDPLTLQDALFCDLEMQGRKACKGPPQYDHSVGLWKDRAQMETKAPDVVVSYGGNNGAEPGVLSRGGFADTVVPVLRANWPHQCRATRIDSCVDLWDAFDPIEAQMQRMHVERRIKRNRYGVPETGQTFMLGGSQSPVQVRLYQKSLQMRSTIHPKEWPAFRLWDRLEVEYHPRAAEKDRAIHMSALDVWGAARWARDLLQWVGESLKPTLMTRTPRMERTPQERLEFLFRQYARTILEVGPDDAQALLQRVFTGDLAPLTRDELQGHGSRPQPRATMQ